MTASVDIKLHGDAIQALRAERVTPAVVRILRKAGATALRDMRSETSKRVRARKRIKVRAVKRALRLRKAKGSKFEDMEWSLDVADIPMRVADYPHRQTKRGVSAAINRGSRSLIRSAFIATMPSGHKGVFIRRGRKRLPIVEVMASRVIDAISHEGEILAISLRGRESFLRAVDRLTPS